jgi:CBS domain-containing protein
VHPLLLQAIQVLSARTLSILAVVNTNGLMRERPLLGTITRMTLLQEVARHRELLGVAAGIRVRTIMATKRAILSCSEALTVRQALQIIFNNNLFGLPIVDDSNRLVAHLHVGLSAVQELVYLPTAEFEACMVLPVREFLSSAKRTTTGSIYESSYPITVRWGDSLGSVIELMAAAHLTAIPVVDECMVLVGKINIIDVLKLVL